MISGIDLNAVVDYTLKDDTENPTIWKLGILPSDLFGKITSKTDIEAAYKLLQLTIRGWSNFNIEYTTIKEKIYGVEMDIIPLSTLQRIPLKIITELSMKVLEMHGITPAEQKN